MNRRQVLALLGSAAVGGCLGGESGTSTTQRTTAETATGTTTKTAQTTTPETTTPEPPEVGEPLPSDCPVFDDEYVQRVVCYPGSDAPLSMTPSADAVSLPNASLSFTLANETDATFEANFYGWRLHKRVEEEWYYIAPGMWPEPLHRLPAGESHAWNVTVDNADLGSEIRDPSSTQDLTLRGLGGGTYSFGTAGWFPGQHYTNKTAIVAQFTLDGDPISLSRTDSVERVERDGDTVVIRMPDRDTTETVTVTRVEESPEESERLITEQIVRHTPLRNALASFEEGVETVRVENAVNRVHSAIYVDEQKYVEYEGEAFRVDVEDETTSA